jgi:hypothetical protein
LCNVSDNSCSRTGEKWWYKDVQTVERTSKTRRLLPDKYRKEFAKKQIVCIEYKDITEADEREIFQVCLGFFFSRYGILLTRIIFLQRAQLGIALTPLGQPESVTSILTFAPDNIINSLF